MKTQVFISIPGLELNTTPFQPPMGRSKHAIVSWPKIGHGRLWRPIFVFCLFSLMEKVKSVFLIKKLENWNNRNGILWSNGNKGLLLENLEFQICLLLKTAKIRLFLYAPIWPSASLFFQISFWPRLCGSLGLKKSQKIFGKQKISWFWHIEKKKFHKINWCLFLKIRTSYFIPFFDFQTFLLNKVNSQFQFYVIKKSKKRKTLKTN